MRSTRFAPVEDATQEPYRAIVGVYVTRQDGSVLRGAGAVVGPNDVLTAAHLLQPDVGGGVQSVEVRAVGSSGGFTEIYDASFRSVNRLDSDGDGQLTRDESMRDFALLTVEDPTPIGLTTGWMEITPDAPATYDTLRLASAGFPAGPQSDPLQPQMFVTNGVEYFDGRVIRHDIASETGLDWSGASGSPFWLDDPAPDDGQAARIVGVFSTGDRAGYITGEVYAEIAGWMRKNDSLHLTGDDSNNHLCGGARDDVLTGRAGKDRLEGQGGDDVLLGNRGADIGSGGAGHDLVSGGRGHDALRGGRNADTLAGGRGRDEIDGGHGKDLVDGGPGLDILAGGSGADTFHFERGDGTRDVIVDFELSRDGFIMGAGARDMSDVLITDCVAGALVSFSDVQVLVEGVEAAALDDGFFDFG